MYRPGVRKTIVDDFLIAILTGVLFAAASVYWAPVRVCLLVSALSSGRYRRCGCNKTHFDRPHRRVRFSTVAISSAKIRNTYIVIYIRMLYHVHCREDEPDNFYLHTCTWTSLRFRDVKQLVVLVQQHKYYKYLRSTR